MATNDNDEDSAVADNEDDVCLLEDMGKLHRAAFNLRLEG